MNPRNKAGVYCHMVTDKAEKDRPATPLNIRLGGGEPDTDVLLLKFDSLYNPIEQAWFDILAARIRTEKYISALYRVGASFIVVEFSADGVGSVVSSIRVIRAVREALVLDRRLFCTASLALAVDREDVPATIVDLAHIIAGTTDDHVSRGDVQFSHYADAPPLTHPDGTTAHLLSIEKELYRG